MAQQFIARSQLWTMPFTISCMIPSARACAEEDEASYPHCHGSCTSSLDRARSSPWIGMAAVTTEVVADPGCMSSPLPPIGQSIWPASCRRWRYVLYRVIHSERPENLPNKYWDNWGKNKRPPMIQMRDYLGLRTVPSTESSRTGLRSRLSLSLTSLGRGVQPGMSSDNDA